MQPHARCRVSSRPSKASATPRKPTLRVQVETLTRARFSCATRWYAVGSADSSEHMCKATQTDCVPGDEYVPVDLVVGKVFVLLWPRDRFDWVTRPSTFEDVPDAS